TLFVAVLLLTGVALIVNTTALTLRSSRRAALLVGGLAAVIGLSVALLFALGTPWRGPITVSGQPIDAVVRDLNIGYFHPLSRPARAPCGVIAERARRAARGRPIRRARLRALRHGNRRSVGRRVGRRPRRGTTVSATCRS